MPYKERLGCTAKAAESALGFERVCLAAVAFLAGLAALGWLT
jgi:hypothetical protein